MDYPRGLFVDNNGSNPTSANALAGTMIFANNLVAGNVAGQVIEPNNTSVFPTIYSWFASNHNDSLVSTSGLLTRPYDWTNPDFRPATGSIALN